LAEFARSVTKYNELHLVREGLNPCSFIQLSPSSHDLISVSVFFFEQRFQQSRDSDVSRLNLQNILELMKSNIEDHFKERVLALYVSQQMSSTFIVSRSRVGFLPESKKCAKCVAQTTLGINFGFAGGNVDLIG